MCIRDRLATQPRRAGTAFRVRSRNWHLGTELRHGPWGRDWKVRVFSSDQRYTAAKVHEHVQNLDNVESLEGELLHYPYRDLSHPVSYTHLRAHETGRNLVCR